MSWQDVSSELKAGLYAGIVMGIFIGGFLYMWLIEEPASKRVEVSVMECANNQYDSNSALGDCLHNALSSR